jgi:DeoR family glycerol-3-phosphate regulon repressor
MSPNARQTELLDLVKAQGVASIECLAEKFGVTLQTVRRDVQRLSEAGFLTRFHGGVRVPTSTTENLAYRQRQALHNEGKARIAKAIAQRVPNGCSLIMNIGTTIEAVARELMQHKDLRVITNNLNIAALLSGNADCEVIVTGGVVRGLDQGVVGEATVDFIRQFRVDIGLIGISGIEADGTLRDYDYREVKVSRAIIEHSREVWLAADHSKFNRPAMVELAAMADIDRVFTDQAPPETFARTMEQAGVECITAMPE